jgi:hypothetical protein
MLEAEEVSLLKASTLLKGPLEQVGLFVSLA